MEISTARTADAGIADERAGILPPLADDPGAKRRHEIALAAAVFIHAAVIALFLLGPPAHEPAPETAIPVEVVTLAPEPEPEPEAAPAPEPEAQAEAAPEPRQEQNVGESGGDPDLAPGKKELAAAPRPQPAPEPVAKPVPKPEAPRAEKPAAETELTLFDEPEPSAIPFAPPPVPPEAERQAALQSGDAETLVNPSLVTGEGGGDAYLNALRDSVIKKLIFPASSELAGVSGTAQYQIVVDREGRLLQAELVQSAGNATLDRVGLNSIKRAAPFGPLPDRIHGETVGILVVLFMKPFS